MEKSAKVNAKVEAKPNALICDATRTHLEFLWLTPLACAPFKRLDKQTAQRYRYKYRYRYRQRHRAQKESRSGLYWSCLVQSGPVRHRGVWDQTTKWVSYLMEHRVHPPPHHNPLRHSSPPLSFSSYLRLKFFDWIVANCLQIYLDFDSFSRLRPPSNNCFLFCLEVFAATQRERGRETYLVYRQICVYILSRIDKDSIRLDSTWHWVMVLTAAKCQRRPQNSFCRGF